jgi:hypothetical protein
MSGVVGGSGVVCGSGGGVFWGAFPSRSAHCSDSSCDRGGSHWRPLGAGVLVVGGEDGAVGTVVGSGSGGGGALNTSTIVTVGAG